MKAKDSASFWQLLQVFISGFAISYGFIFLLNI